MSKPRIAVIGDIILDRHVYGVIERQSPEAPNVPVLKLDYDGFSNSGWTADYVDPNTFLSMFQTPGGSNATGWWSKSYSDGLDAANRTRDPVERFEKMAAVEEELLASGAVIPLFIGNQAWVKKPYVKGMYTNPITFYPWKFVSIEHDRARWGDDSPRGEP